MFLKWWQGCTFIMYPYYFILNNNYNNCYGRILVTEEKHSVFIMASINSAQMIFL